jgi:putative membrane protein
MTIASKQPQPPASALHWFLAEGSMYRSSFLAMATTIITSGALLGAQSPATKAQSPDRAFVMEAAMGGMAEVDLGQLASSKASSDKVKMFGQRMVTDHGKAGDELKTLAASKQITVPTSIGTKHQAEHARFAKLSGADFDRAYVKDMVADHKKDVAAFMKESKSGKDPDVKAWAAKTLPTLQEHLKMIEELDKEMSTARSTK